MSRRFQFKPMYQALRQDGRTTCPEGHRVTLLTPRCLTPMPKFYICDSCSFIGEIGVGVVRKATAVNR